MLKRVHLLSLDLNKSEGATAGFANISEVMITKWNASNAPQALRAPNIPAAMVM
jgi:hypothetical protein